MPTLIDLDIHEPESGLPRVGLLRTRVNKGSSPLLWVTLNLLGVVKPCRGKEQKHPAVGTRALLQPRAYVGGPRLPRRGGDLLRAQGQGQRHSALHLRDARGLEDRGGRRVRRLAVGVESPTSRKPLTRIRLIRRVKVPKASIDDQGE